MTIRPGFRLCGEPSEADVQREVIATLSAIPEVALVCRVNAGMFSREDTRGKRQLYSFCTIHSRLAIEYLALHHKRYNALAAAKLSMPDIIGMLAGGRMFAFEVKRRGKKATPGQAAMLDLVRFQGGISGVVYSAKDAVELVGARSEAPPAKAGGF